MVAIEAMGMNEIFHEEEIIQEAKSGKLPKYQDMWISKWHKLKGTVSRKKGRH